MINEYTFDIEANGYYEEATVIHSLVLKHRGTGEIISCADQPGYRPIAEGIKLLENADLLVGHNILDYDLPVIKKLLPYFKTKAAIRDTLVESRLIFTSLIKYDFAKWKHVPPKLKGRHSLEAWGHRLHLHKGDFNDFEKWSKEMQDYCVQDVQVNDRLADMLEEKEYSKEALNLEHDFAKVLIRQMRHGVHFDRDRAKQLFTEITSEKTPLEYAIQEAIPPRVEKIPFTPKANNSKYGYVKGVPTFKLNKIVFNPGSRQQIIKFLKSKYKWEPVEFTEKGNPVCSGEVLENLPYREAKLFAKYLQIQKLQGQLATGPKAWLKLADLATGKIYGYINHNGARTGRCTHGDPNLAQIPRITSYKGKECRSVFTAPPRGVLVGADAAGLELRNLAHYLFPYDEGEYARAILQSDIHTKNGRAARLDEGDNLFRDKAKRLIYAHNYGAGDEKLGSIINPAASKREQKRIGAQVRRAFMANTKGLSQLLAQIKRVHKRRGYFKGLDGRKLDSVSEHSALNTLLQGAGAIIMQQATVFLWEEIDSRGWDEFVFPALHVHDEYQLAVYKPEYADEVGQLMVDCIVRAGEHFNYKIPLAGEYKVGANWAETH